MLVSKLPGDWKVVDRKAAEVVRQGPDAIMEVTAPDGKKALLLVEAKADLEPRNVVKALEQVRKFGEGTPFIVSDFLTPRAREMLVQFGAGYADATGNLRLALSKPALFIQTKGADRDPWPDKKPLRSLKGRAAGRLVRALCDLELPFGVRELAARAGVSPASASRVLALLERDALIERDNNDCVNRVRKADLIRRWVQDYSVLKSNIAENFLEPRGIAALLTKLKAAKFNYAVTGPLAASFISSAAPPRIVTIYVDDFQKAADLLELKRSETGTNVILAEAFDPVVFDRTSDQNGVRCVALSQLCADLLTGPGRDPAEGEELLRKLDSSEPTPRTEKRAAGR